MTDTEPAFSAAAGPSPTCQASAPDTGELNALDVVPPARIAALVEQVGVRKSQLPVLQTLVLAILAGAFIAFGGMAYTVAVTGSEWGYGPTRLLGGLAFSLGLILVVIGGAELFTGNKSHRHGLGRREGQPD